MKTTEEIIRDLKYANANLAYIIIMNKYGSVKALIDHYEKRPFDGAWVDVKNLIDISKTEEFKFIINQK